MERDAKRPLVNYHAHTWRCKHAGGFEEDYVRAAVDAGYRVFGFSDHSPWPYKSGFVSHIRMTVDQFPDYLRTVRALSKKYADRLQIPVGLECEAFPEYYGWLADIKAQYLDYAILGNHYELSDETNGFYFGRCSHPEQIRRYADTTLDGMRTGLYNYVAHPDLFCSGYAKFDADCAAVSRDLCQAAKALDLPLEYNLLGVQYHSRAEAEGRLGYPCQGFWEIAAETGCRAIVGLDAHQTAHVFRRDLFDAARETLTSMGLKILDDLNIIPRGGNGDDE